MGPKRALALEKIGIRSIRDLLYFFPRRYEDRSQFRSIDQTTPGEFATIRGEVLAVTLKRLRHTTLLEVKVGDDTGIIPAVWFNQPYLKNTFQAGQQVILYGKIDFYQNRLQLSSPEYEIIEGDEESTHTGRITPIYPLTEGLFQRSLRNTLRETVQHQIHGQIREFLPASFREMKNLIPLSDAIEQMHFPASFESLETARRRIVYDEFLVFQLILSKKIERLKTKFKSFPLKCGQDLMREFTSKLPFQLTPSQQGAIHRLSEGLAQEHPMNQLLQGDVGSGKTVVAAFGLMLAARNSRQAAVLVPTEILAEQHYRTLSQFLVPHGISIGLLTSSTPAPKRERMIAELKQGNLSILIGTHALLQEDVVFQSLAFLIIDEQHKFGVAQRSKLLTQTLRPHHLVMSATPIPRTLALTVYGDLEVSTLKELPAGRQPIKTYKVSRKKQEAALLHILEKVKSGEQAYFVFPLIDETEKSDMLAAKNEYDRLKSGIFREVKMGLVHGRLENAARDSVMKAFRNGEIQILVATSVIEVGVDNPNATIIVIENSERFGLSQLHQLRGRIGRGSKASACFLFGEPKTEEGKKRLAIMTSTQDGFLIAEEDLKLRGPGDFLGTRQSGEPIFRVGNPVTDQALLLDARDTARELIQKNALESDPQWKELRHTLQNAPLDY